MPAEVIRTGMDKLPGVRFITGFGMTELSGNIFYMIPTRTSPRSRATRRAQLGREARWRWPIARVVDDAMNDVPVGEVGELVVQGDQVLHRLLAAAGGQRGGVLRRLVPHRRPRPSGTPRATSTSSTARRT